MLTNLRKTGIVDLEMSNLLVVTKGSVVVKKLVPVILALLMTVSMLVACERQKPHTTDTTTTNDIELSGNDKEIKEKQICRAIAEGFLTALKNRNLKDVLHYLETEDTDAYKFLTDLNLESYSIVEEIEVYGSAMKYVVQLDITGSGSDLFPVGKSMWEVGVEEPEAGNGGITLFKPVTNKINRIKYDKQSKDIDFCADFFELLEPYVISASDLNKMVPDIKDAEPYNDFCESLIIFLRRYGLPEENTPADSVMAEAKRVLGITKIDLKKYSYYIESEGTVSTWSTAGISYFGSVVSREYDPQTRQSTIILDYYSDSAHLLKGKTVKFIVKENEDKSFTMLSTEILYDSGVDLPYYVY